MQVLKTTVIDNYEDFAWWIESESEIRMPWALLGYVGDGPVEWLLQVKSNVGWFARLLGRSDVEGRRVFCDNLQAVLTSEPAFSEIRWHLDDWSKPGWANTPEE